MTQSIVCSACGATVPYGRLSCQECGELLASVASVRRTPDVLREVEAPTSDAGGAAVPDPIVVSGASRWAADDDGFGALLSETSGPMTASPSPAPAVGTFAAAAAGAGAGPVVAPTPGSYVPPAPSAPMSPAPVAAAPAGPPAPARAWAGHAGGGSAVDDPASDQRATATSGSASGSLLAGERGAEFVGWLAIAGGALALVGMVLPWSALTVIGAGGVGYFDRWGLAGPGHLLVVLAIVGVLAIALLRDRVPIGLGIGLSGPVLGGLLVGLTWPYLIGPLGGQLGAWAVALGGALLAAAGIAARFVDRHAADDSAV